MNLRRGLQRRNTSGEALAELSSFGMSGGDLLGCAESGAEPAHFFVVVFFAGFVAVALAVAFAGFADFFVVVRALVPLVGPP